MEKIFISRETSQPVMDTLSTQQPVDLFLAGGLAVTPWPAHAQVFLRQRTAKTSITKLKKTRGAVFEIPKLDTSNTPAYFRYSDVFIKPGTEPKILKVTGLLLKD